MPDQTMPAGAAPESELREELARREEEILRLRDLLIGRDRELGAVRGQLTMLEVNSRRLLGLALRIQARLPGTVRLAAKAARGLRKQRS